uniref:glutathione hydrolase-like YwrD proenzyme isoform X2 n=1 Tax=Styela clava TaxID=7725 RepID=UPI00193A57EB|nr:glutathione hydrolase-like YwrD proenzyme isoform X2 [Styela clava]
MANYISNRSVITCLHGCAASSQPLASQIGIDILKKGGNAADAAVAMAAALNVTEPCSTGLGGDAFCLFFDNKNQSVKAMNASGRSPENLTLDMLNSKGFDKETGFPKIHGLAVTVPGAAAGWIDCVEKFGSGKLSPKEILNPAIDLARNGFPVAGPHTSFSWGRGEKTLLNSNNIHRGDMLIRHQSSDGSTTFSAPKHGEIFKNPNLARVMEELSEKGKKGFYEGWVADAIVAAVKKFDGVMEKEDLLANESSFESPLSIAYKDITLWETAPNSQGIVALITLNILKNFDLKQHKPDSPEYLHILIEALKLGFADGVAYVADPSKSQVPIEGLLSKEYGKERAKLIKENCVIKMPNAGHPQNFGKDTVYFTVVDKDRNACSFINSNYEGFGTGIVPEGCGFTLQNRGANFSLDPDHPNVAAPGKRTYHTIIPGMLTDSTTGELLMSFGVMGAFMQPQGHVQVLINCVEFNMNPQEALDHPRIRVSPNDTPVYFEEGIPVDTLEKLRKLGHKLEGPSCGLDRFPFGKGQAIATGSFWDADGFDKENLGKVLWAGSDPRCDGAACGY